MTRPNPPGAADTAAAIELPGPWQHRYVAANGARFHLAVAGPETGPMVLLLHGFPQFWWAWRAQLPALAEAGYRAVAMDLRGYGGSDKPPRGYDPITLAQDVASVVKALGPGRATVVGQGWGGYVGWATTALHPSVVTALAAVASPHPLTMLGSPWSVSRPAAWRHLLAMQVPWQPERRLADPSRDLVRRHLSAWGAAPGFPEPEVAATYQRAIGIWPAAHCALEYHRWLWRSRFRSDGRRFSAAMAEPVAQPVLEVTGAADPVLRPPTRRSHRWVSGPLTEVELPGVGHFPPEESPEALTDALLDWLAELEHHRH